VGASRRLVESGQAVLIDARPQESFKLGHIAGAANLPPALFDFMYGMRLAKLPPERPVLVYGRTVSRLYDEAVADLLKKRGHKDVRIIQGGMEAWKRAGGTLKP
jgi:rhodanese-related sulfurtransferase